VRERGPPRGAAARPQAEGIIACDFSTVETAWLRTLYVLVFIELGSRRIHLSPSTVHPDSAWVTQQARNLAMNLDGRSPAIRFLIRDRDTKFSRSFDTVLRSEGMRVSLAAPLVASGGPILVNPRDVHRRDLLGGLVHEYHGAAAGSNRGF
jgi:putative transposase